MDIMCAMEFIIITYNDLRLFHVPSSNVISDILPALNRLLVQKIYFYSEGPATENPCNASVVKIFSKIQLH